MLTLGSEVAGDKSAQTVRTYRGACERLAAWLVAVEGPQAGAEQLTLERLAAYEVGLREAGRSEATIRKDRSPINRFVRFLAEFELVDRGQARLLLARQLPVPGTGDRERPNALSELAWASWSPKPRRP